MTSLPTSIDRVFSQSDPELVLELLSGRESRRQPNLVMALLGDTLDRVQVIYPAGCLLDIDGLNKALGQSLTALPEAERGRLLSRLKLVTLPALPGLTGFDTILDTKVATQDPVVLDSGYADTLIQLPLAGYQALTGDARTIDCAIPLDSISVNFDRPEQDLAQIGEALQRFTRLRIKQRLEDTLELPPLPETAQRIIRLRVNPNAEVGHLADVVESDPSLAAQVVSWANSSFYAAPSPVRSIYDAIMRVLGFELVMNLAMGLSLGRTLKQPEDRPEGLPDYWQQAIWVAQASAVVSGLMPRKHRPAYGLAYLSGLLHNFGYLVLAEVFPPHWKLICRYTEANRDVDTAYIDHYLLGITREQIAAQLMERWGMPDEVVTALRHQKNPEFSGEHAVYSQVLCLARQLLLARGIPVGAPEGVRDNLVAELGINREELDSAMDELVASRQDVLTMADMMRGS